MGSPSQVSLLRWDPRQPMLDPEPKETLRSELSKTGSKDSTCIFSGPVGHFPLLELARLFFLSSLTQVTRLTLPRTACRLEFYVFSP